MFITSIYSVWKYESILHILAMLVISIFLFPFVKLSEENHFNIVSIAFLELLLILNLCSFFH